MLYTENGYTNIRWVLNTKPPWAWIHGGRGSGKTYNAFDAALTDKIPFMLVRNTQSQLDAISTPAMSPLRKYNQDHGTDYRIEKAGDYLSVIVDGDNNECGMAVALSTFSNIRSFSAEHIKLIWFDEFVQEKHARKMKYACEALDNLYESVNRNRELYGEKPVKFLGTSNTDTLGNPFYIGYELVTIATRMKQKGLESATSPDGKHIIFDTFKSPIINAKANTSQYKGRNDAFSNMAIRGEFDRISTSTIGGRSLKEYSPVATLGEITIYQHKSKPEYYITQHRSGNPPKFSALDMDVQRFATSNKWIFLAYMRNSITFENELCEILFTKYLY